LFQLAACVHGFEHLKCLYAEDKGFGELYVKWSKHPKGDFLVEEGFLFKSTRLCVPKYSAREILSREVHGGSLARHYGESKTLIMLREQYY